MIIKPENQSVKDVSKLMIGSIVPRPGLSINNI